MLQAVNLVEQREQAGNRVALALQNTFQRSPIQSRKNIKSFILQRTCSDEVRVRLLTAEDIWGHIGATTSSFRRVAPNPFLRSKMPLYDCNQKCQAPAGETARLFDRARTVS